MNLSKGFKKFFKQENNAGTSGKNRKQSDSENWQNQTVSEILKSMVPDDALAEDKKLEALEDVDQSRNWFHAHTKRKLAEQKLVEAGKKPGTFLVREDVSPGNFVLSMVAGKQLCHYKVLQAQGGRGSYHLQESNTDLFRGIDQVVEALKIDSKKLKSRLVHHLPSMSPPHESRAFGFTNLLHRAIKNGDTQSALEILQSSNRPSVNAKNSEGNTALHIACKSKQTKVVEKLLELGAKTDIPQLDGYTALMVCSVENCPIMTRILIEQGEADPQDADVSTGNVALHKAAEMGHLECVKMLLSLKAPAFPRNHELRSPLELARHNGHTDCANYIENHEATPAETTREEWFHGTLSRTEGENIIKKHGWSDGLFLVRKSSTRPNIYILVVCHESVTYNYEIRSVENKAFFIDDGTILKSLEHLVEHYCIRASGLPTRLVKAIDPNDKIRPMKWKKGSRDRSRESPSLVSPYETAMSSRSALEPHKLDPKSVELGADLGEGEYGSVFRGVWTSANNERVPVAVKTLHAKHTPSARDNFLREASVMVKLTHPCIVRLIGVCLEDPIMLVQELVELGSMLDYMLDYQERISRDSDLYLWAAQIACGMTYLEKNHMVHRDLAARNILLESKKQAKVGDFGLSRGTSEQTNAYQASVGGRWPIKWYAPECVNFGTFSSKSDVWSYGVTLWEMFTLGDQPYGEKTGGEVISMLEKGGRLKKPPQCPEKVYSLMQECWKYEPSERPNFSQLRNHFNTEPEYSSIKDHIILNNPAAGTSSET